MYLLGDLLQLVYEVVQHAELYAVLSGVAYLSVYPLALACLFSFPSPRRSRGERFRLSLDLAVVFAAGVTVTWYVVLGPAIAATRSFGLTDLVALACTAGNGVLLFGVIALLARGVLQASQAALRLIAAGLGVFIAASLLFGYAVTHGGYHGGDRLDAVWVVAMTLMFLAASCQLRAQSQPLLSHCQADAGFAAQPATLPRRRGQLWPADRGCRQQSDAVPARGATGRCRPAQHSGKRPSTHCHARQPSLGGSLSSPCHRGWPNGSV